MWQALEKYMLNSRKPHHILAQPWFPIHIEDDRVLRSSGQYVRSPLISHDQIKIEMSKRYIFDSLKKVFPIDEKSGKSLGVIDEHTPVLSYLEMGICLVNRWVAITAFRLGKLQWAPNLHIYSEPHYMIFGTLALPVFEGSTNSCVGVFELIIDSPEIDYAAEVEEICKYLQEVHLRAETRLVNQPRQMALVEIFNILRNACQIHNLPLAQTWLPCMCCDESCRAMRICMSSAEIPFILLDPTLFPFWQASSMYHMCKGQGVAGRAFSSKASCFCNDITQFPENNFPLVCTTRKYQIYSSLAICLKSSYTGTDLYVVQFFLPKKLVNVNERKNAVDSITKTMKQNFGSMSFVSSKLEEIDARSGKIVTRKWINIPYLFDELNYTASPSNAWVGFGVTNADMIQMEEACRDQLMDNLNVGAKTIRRKKVENLVSSKEDLLPYLGGTVEDASTSLGVSKSTTKRMIKDLNFKGWRDAQNYFDLPPTKRKSRAHKRDVVDKFDKPSS